MSKVSPDNPSMNRDAWLKRFEKIMGSPPAFDPDAPVVVTVLDERHVDGATRYRVDYVPELDDHVPAWLFVPDTPLEHKPAMLCLHQTFAGGKDEPAGLAGKADLHYALELARRGYVTLAPDAMGFGEYQHVPGNMSQYQSGSMKSIHNHRVGVSLLAQREDVHGNRIGSIGHSLGGHNSIFLAAFDPRVAAVVTSCGFTTWAGYALDKGDLSAWAQPRYMPRIAEVYDSDPAKMPLLFQDILRLFAPRPLFVNAPVDDDNFNLDGVKQCVTALRPIYEQAQATQDLVAVYPDAKHEFPGVIRQQAYAFLDRVLNR